VTALIDPFHSWRQGPANVDAIGLLIEKGSKVGSVLENPALETPLHIAARCGRLDIIQSLLRCKVPVNVKAKGPPPPPPPSPHRRRRQS
jgi:hypothetical protein